MACVMMMQAAHGRYDSALADQQGYMLLPSPRWFGCDSPECPTAFTAVQGSVADVVPFMYVGSW